MTRIVARHIHSIAKTLSPESEYMKIHIQLFRQRLPKKSVKAYATMPKGCLGNTQ